jgi:diketogulonate reductase-like aldo/keto reductase
MGLTPKYTWEAAFCVVKVVNETLPALVKLREQGLVRFIGITGLPLKIFPYILDRQVHAHH